MHSRISITDVLNERGMSRECVGNQHEICFISKQIKYTVIKDDAPCIVEINTLHYN